MTKRCRDNKHKAKTLQVPQHPRRSAPDTDLAVTVHMALKNYLSVGLDRGQTGGNLKFDSHRVIILGNEDNPHRLESGLKEHNRLSYRPLKITQRFRVAMEKIGEIRNPVLLDAYGNIPLASIEDIL